MMKLDDILLEFSLEEIESNHYSILKFEKTGEFHVFHTEINSDDKCAPVEKLSLCGAMTTKDGSWHGEICQTAHEIRHALADLGLIACGNCVRKLYKTE